jgi:uncharacterized protein
MKQKISNSRWISRLAGIHGEPRPIALGYALGIFLAASPLMGLHCILAVVISGALKWNRIAAGFGAFHSNLLTAPLIYSTTFFVGSRLMGFDSSFVMPHKPAELLNMGSEVFISLIIGGLFLGIPIAILSYYFGIFFIKRCRTYLNLKSNSNEN